MDEIKKRIEEGRTTLGIEFGSTRVKAVLVDETFQPIASGNYRWENQLVDGYWTYSLEEIITGLQESYQNLVLEVQKKYGVVLTKIGAIGFSAMMHGYMAFDKEDNLLVPFRTCRPHRRHRHLLQSGRGGGSEKRRYRHHHLQQHDDAGDHYGG